MSIINEALKKTEEQLQKNSAKDTTVKIPHPGARPVLLYILILAAGILLAHLIFNQLGRRVQTKITPKNAALPKPLPPNPLAGPLPVARVLPEEKKTPETDFILNGIFYSDNSGYALINNQIVRENDYVDGAKVNTITAKTVELDKNGIKITLATRR